MEGTASTIIKGLVIFYVFIGYGLVAGAIFKGIMPDSTWGYIVIGIFCGLAGAECYLRKIRFSSTANAGVKEMKESLAQVDKEYEDEVKSIEREHRY